MQFPLEANFFRQDRVDAGIFCLVKRYDQFSQSFERISISMSVAWRSSVAPLESTERDSFLRNESWGISHFPEASSNEIRWEDFEVQGLSLQPSHKVWILWFLSMRGCNSKPSLIGFRKKRRFLSSNGIPWWLFQDWMHMNDDRREISQAPIWWFILKRIVSLILSWQTKHSFK